MNIVFMGTPSIAQQVLASIEQYCTITAVYTRPDKPAGRGKKIQYSPVKQHALEKGYSIEQPTSLRTNEATSIISRYAPACIVVVAYGMLLPQAMLDIPRYGVINIHGSLLPKYRGAAPIQRALWNGEQRTGVTIMQLDAGMDTGNILLTSSFPVEYTDTTYTLMHRMATFGSRALLRTLSYYMVKEEYPTISNEECARLVQNHSLYSITENDTIEDYVLTPQIQDNTLATYAQKIEPEEEYINWTQPSSCVHNQIQALTYSTVPKASTFLYRENTTPLRIKIPLGQYTTQITSHKAGTIIGIENGMLHIACGQGTYALHSLRPENKKDISALDFYNGYCKRYSAYFA